MDEIQLRNALRLGLGRAILFAKRHDLREFRAVILDACLHCYVYDIQTEGARGSYMYDFVSLLPDKDFYYNEVLASLKESGDGPDAVQRFHFATCLAMDGNRDAKRAMYASYDPGPVMGQSIGIHFLHMDGMEGFLFAARKIGARLIGNPEATAGDYLLSQSLEILGEQPVVDALRSAGATDPCIEKYRLAVEESRRRSEESRQQWETLPQKYKQMLNEFPLNKPYLFWKWGKQASDEDLDSAARGLLAAKDSKQQRAHLWIFRERRFPIDPSALLPLVDIAEDRVGLAAMRALANIPHPAVRDFAFRLVNTRARWRGEAIALIAQNYERGDHEIVLRWFQTEEDCETQHSLGMDLIDFWKRHPNEETEFPMLQSLYEKGPCSVCRERTVERLLELGALTDEMRAECAWDANDDIRDLVAKKSSTPS